MHMIDSPTVRIWYITFHDHMLKCRLDIILYGKLPRLYTNAVCILINFIYKWSVGCKNLTGKMTLLVLLNSSLGLAIYLYGVVHCLIEWKWSVSLLSSVTSFSRICLYVYSLSGFAMARASLSVDFACVVTWFVSYNVFTNWYRDNTTLRTYSLHTIKYP